MVHRPAPDSVGVLGGKARPMNFMEKHWGLVTTVATVLITAGMMLSSVNDMKETLASQGKLLMAMKSALEIHIGQAITVK